MKYFARQNAQTVVVKPGRVCQDRRKTGGRENGKTDKAAEEEKSWLSRDQDKRSASFGFTSSERENVTSHLATLHSPRPGYPAPLLRKIWPPFQSGFAN